MQKENPFVVCRQRNLASAAMPSQDAGTLNETTIIAATLCGAALGTGIAWLFLRQRIGVAVAGSEARSQAAHADEKLALSKSLATAEAIEAAARARIGELQRECEERMRELSELRKGKGDADARNAALQTQLAEQAQQAAEKLALLDDAQKKLLDAFHALSAQALQKNNAAFLDLAHATLGKFQEKASGDLAQKEQAIAELLKPVRESLGKVDVQIHQMEEKRAKAYGELQSQVETMTRDQRELRSETGRLVSVLRSSGARGRWGEIQLRRVVELAGMQDHCDFDEQKSVEGESGRLRPDMVVKMPGGKTVVVDSKVPFSAYERAVTADTEADRLRGYQDHAAAVREHIRQLSGKAYWEQFDNAPEFVILFLPAETFFGAAVEHDPELIEFSAKNHVMITTPMTLIALLRAVYYGWKQEKLAENAAQISDLGRDLYERLITLGDHMSKLGRHLDNAVDSYNRAAGSLETRVLVGARRFKELKAAPGDKELKPLDPIEHTTRKLQAPEMQPNGGGEPAEPAAE